MKYPPKKIKKETCAAGSTDVTTTHDDGVGQNCSRANGADVTGWGWGPGGVSSGLNPIIDASHCVPRQQCISNRALFKSSGLISGKAVRGDLALTGHTVPVKTDRVCASVCGVCMRVCVSKYINNKKNCILSRRESYDGGACAGVRASERVPERRERK